MNTVTFRGWTVNDPEVKTTPTGKTVVRFSISTKAKFRKDDKGKYTSFFDIVYWPNDQVDGNVQREIAKLRKGLPIVFDAEPQQERWESEGQKRSRVVFVVEGWVEVLEHHKKEDQPPTYEPNDEIPF